jgi:hypothetical protein
MLAEKKTSGPNTNYIGILLGYKGQRYGNPLQIGSYPQQSKSERFRGITEEFPVEVPSYQYTSQCQNVLTFAEMFKISGICLGAELRN